MIQSKVYKLKADAVVMKDLLLKAKQEIEIVMDVVYMSGHPLPPNLQPIFYNWITGNPKLFDDVTRNW